MSGTRLSTSAIASRTREPDRPYWCLGHPNLFQSLAIQFRQKTPDYMKVILDQKCLKLATVYMLGKELMGNWRMIGTTYIPFKDPHHENFNFLTVVHGPASNWNNLLEKSNLNVVSYAPQEPNPSCKIRYFTS